MAFEHAVGSTTSDWGCLGVLGSWEWLAGLGALAYAMAIASRRSLLSTRGFIAAVAVPTMWGVAMSYLEMGLLAPVVWERYASAPARLSLETIRDSYSHSLVLAGSQALLLIGLLSSSAVAAAGILQSQVADDDSAPPWRVLAPGAVLVVAEVALALYPEHLQSAYATLISIFGAVASLFVMLLLVACLLRSRADEEAPRWGRPALTIAMAPFPVAAVALVLLLEIRYDVWPLPVV
jgi:hypothetical protein